MDGTRISVPDLTFIARAVAYHSKEASGYTVCSVGYSDIYGLIRVYPLPANNNVKAWHTYHVELERSKNDTRSESWKLVPGSLIKPSKPHKRDRYEAIEQLMKRYMATTLNALNCQRRSLGILGANLLVKKAYLKPLAVDDRFGGRSIGVEPRLKLRDIVTGSRYDWHIVETGAYQWLRNNRNNMQQVFVNYRFFDDEYWHLFLVGNMRYHRNAWLLISPIPVKTSRIPDAIFRVVFRRIVDRMPDNYPAGWEYIGKRIESLWERDRVMWEQIAKNAVGPSGHWGSEWHVSPCIALTKTTLSFNYPSQEAYGIKAGGEFSLHIDKDSRKFGIRLENTTDGSNFIFRRSSKNSKHKKAVVVANNKLLTKVWPDAVGRAYRTFLDRDTKIIEVSVSPENVVKR